MLISFYRESEKGNVEHMFDFECEVLPRQGEVVYENHPGGQRMHIDLNCYIVAG